MNTPVLTKKQQRHSLSAKKGPAKGLRNILAQPSPNFWPVIKVDQYPELVKNINTILPSIKRTNNKIPKYMLKNKSKKDRALARKEMLKTAPPKPDILKFMIMGINEVTRALEKNTVCCVLLDVNVEPSLMIKHIVTMAVNKKIPVLLLPILKTVTLEKMGFATTTFALKQEVKQCPDNVCHPLYKSIAETFEDFKPSECLLQHSDEMANRSEMCEVKIVDMDCNINPKISMDRDINPKISMDCDISPNTSKSEKPVTIFTDVYKYRSSRDKRAFIPPTANENSQVSQTSSDEFIALGSDLDSIDDKNCITIVKSKRYVNIDQEEKRAEKSEDIKKNQSFNKLKLIDNNANSKHTQNYTLKRHRNDEPNYLPLKLKRIQGNNKRRKATKLAKKKRKDT